MEMRDASAGGQLHQVQALVRLLYCAHVKHVAQGRSEYLKGEHQTRQSEPWNQCKVGLAGEQIGVVVANHSAP